MPDHHRRRFLQRTTPKIGVFVTLCYSLNVDRRSASGEVKVADQIDIAPSDGRNAFENLDGVLVIGCKLVLVYPR